MKRRTSLQVVVAIIALVFVLPIGAAQTAEDLVNPPPGEWPTYGRNLEMWRYSPLDQINRDNVSQLRLVWSRDLGFDGLVQSSPVVWNGVMYINGNGAVLALDATNGDLLWEYRPEMPEAIREFFTTRMRGGVVVYDGKVYYDRNDGIIVALDAETGEEVWSTTVGDAELAEGFTSGPIFADGKVIAGLSGADFGGAPGRIVALDSQDGELLWTFNVMPEPGDPAYETWNPIAPSWEAGVGGGSSWNSGTYDPVTRTVIYGTGQPIPWDRYDRRKDEGDTISADLYTASYVALDVDTGELKWYHQVVPGDEWDYDQHPTPVVTDLEIDGQPRRVAILPTTTGFLVLMDVESGEFLAAHDMMAAIWPGAEPRVHEGYEEDGTPIINDDLRPNEPGESVFFCPGRWASFGLGSYSPQTGLYYRPNSHDCLDQIMFPMPEDWQPGESPLDVQRPRNLDYLDHLGAFSAINPVTGEVAWEFKYDYNPMFGGVVATAGNVVFAASPDRIFRAFDAETGELLWQQVLTAHMESNPITYEVDGTQYVATLVGHPTGRQAMHDITTVPGRAAAFVFALPEEAR